MREWPLFLPDLTMWHSWHAGRGTLPDRWKGLDLPGVCRSLGTAAWMPSRRWRVELPGVDVKDERGDSERVLTWRTSAGTLTSRWTLGPDGDWWQAEYPVKSRSHFDAALAVAQSRRYVVDPPPAKGSAAGLFSPLELPQRPWSEVFHSFLGWSEGLMLFLEEPELIQKIVEILEEKLARLEESLAGGPERTAFSPDNLDAQFIPPAAFAEHLAESYGRVASLLHARGKKLVVHVGGPVLRLLPGLAACGVDCVEGTCGPPQGDSPFASARTAAGPAMTLWGGLAQDFLLAGRNEADFNAAAEEAFAHARSDPLCVVGVADKVPVETLPDRLAALARMSAGQG